MANIDQSFIDELVKRLQINANVSMDFNYGQLRRAAIFVVKHSGYGWALHIPKNEESRELRILHGTIRRIVEGAVSAQGKSKQGVWRRFKLHAIKIASHIESRKIISRLSSEL